MLPVLSLLLACSNPNPLDPGEPLFDDETLLVHELPTDRSPAPPTLVLEANNLYAGEFVMLHITEAPPGALLRVAHGRQLGAGPCPPILGGACLSIASPVRLSNYATVADGDGEAWFAVQLPNRRASPLALQVAVTGGAPHVSNPVYRLVGPAGAAGANDQDVDGDGYTPDGGDCADFDTAFHPGAADMLGDGADQDCDNADGTDDDGDGHASVASGGPDCDDLDAAISPEGTESCNDADDDCDGSADPLGTCAGCGLPWGGTLDHDDSVDAYPSATVPYNGTCTAQTRTCDDGVLSGTATAETCAVLAPNDCTLPWGGTLTHGSAVTAYTTATVPHGSTCVSQTRTCTDGALSGSAAHESCAVLPPTTTYMGCYADFTDAVTRDMPHAPYNNGTNSVDTCANTCRSAGYAYSGVQYGTNCFCGNNFGSQGLASKYGYQCNMACPANAGQMCGGTNANAVYATSSVTQQSMGCYKDFTGSVRDLTFNAGVYGNNNVGACASRCRTAGYTFAGVQNGTNCFCGNTVGTQGNSVAGGVTCNIACPGGSTENCGGSAANAVYAVKPIVQQLMGCYADAVSGARDLPNLVYNGGTNNVLSCSSRCRVAGYTYAGVQNANECWCGNSYGSQGTAASLGRTCSSACSGASSETCGGSGANTVYRVQ